jgi:hypothetical protein
VFSDSLAGIHLDGKPAIRKVKPNCLKSRLFGNFTLAFESGFLAKALEAPRSQSLTQPEFAGKRMGWLAAIHLLRSVSGQISNV